MGFDGGRVANRLSLKPRENRFNANKVLNFVLNSYFKLIYSKIIILMHSNQVFKSPITISRFKFLSFSILFSFYC